MIYKLLMLWLIQCSKKIETLRPCSASRNFLYMLWKAACISRRIRFWSVTLKYLILVRGCSGRFLLKNLFVSLRRVTSLYPFDVSIFRKVDVGFSSSNISKDLLFSSASLISLSSHSSISASILHTLSW